MYYIVLIRHPKVPVNLATITWAELRQRINDQVPDDAPVAYIEYDAPREVAVKQLDAGVAVVNGPQH